MGSRVSAGTEGRAFRERVQAESQISITEAGDSSGGAGEKKDKGIQVEKRVGVRLERILRNYLVVKWPILFLVGKWKPVEDSERRDSMVRHAAED